MRRWRLLQELNIPWHLPWDAAWGTSCYERRWAEKGLFWPLQQQSFSTKGTVMLACWHQITLISIFQSPRGQMTHEVFHVEKKSLRKKQKQEQNRLNLFSRTGWRGRGAFWAFRWAAPSGRAPHQYKVHPLRQRHSCSLARAVVNRLQAESLSNRDGEERTAWPGAAWIQGTHPHPCCQVAHIGKAQPRLQMPYLAWTYRAGRELCSTKRFLLNLCCIQHQQELRRLPTHQQGTTSLSPLAYFPAEAPVWTDT